MRRREIQPAPCLKSGNSDGISTLLDEPAPFLDFVAPNPDLTPPELDINRLSVTGATSAKISIVNAGRADAGTYYCVVSNASGRVVSKAASVILRSDGARITIQSDPGAKRITLRWPIGFRLQRSPVLPALSWEDVPGTASTNTLILPTTGPGAQFFRVKND